MTYAASTVNQAARYLLSIGVTLNPTADGTIWARDGMGRAYDRLSDDEAAQGRPVEQAWRGWTAEEREEVERRIQLAKSQRDRLIDVLPLALEALQTGRGLADFEGDDSTTDVCDEAMVALKEASNG